VLAALPGADQRTVLLALYESGEPSASLARAWRLAQKLDAQLHVLRVLPESAYLHPLLPHLNLLNQERALERTRAAQVGVAAWLERELGAQARRVAQHVQCGEFVEVVARRAKALDAELVVVSPRSWRLGTTVTSLARAAERPVLLARGEGRTKTILAATDLRDRGLRVLARAAQLGLTLRADVVGFHNLDPLAVMTEETLATDAEAAPNQLPTSNAAPDATCTSKPPARPKLRLSEVSKRLPVHVEPVVRTEIDPVHAIIDEARGREADIVVVGTHYRKWWSRALLGSVATRVVERARQSVLVTPIGPEAPTRPDV
jgi:nucleotide-binding universal stress UspA family protein